MSSSRSDSSNSVYHSDILGAMSEPSTHITTPDSSVSKPSRASLIERCKVILHNPLSTKPPTDNGSIQVNLDDFFPAPYQHIPRAKKRHGFALPSSAPVQVHKGTFTTRRVSITPPSFIPAPHPKSAKRQVAPPQRRRWSLPPLKVVTGAIKDFLDKDRELHRHEAIYNPPWGTTFIGDGNDESRCLQEVVPGLHVAFESDLFRAAPHSPKGDDLRLPGGGLFTHILRVARNPGWVQGERMGLEMRDDKTGQITVLMTLPPGYGIDEVAGLTQDQLVTARDWMTYHLQAHTFDTPNFELLDPPGTIYPDKSPKFLITVPRDHARQAMVLSMDYVCYAFQPQSLRFGGKVMARQRASEMVERYMTSVTCGAESKKLMSVWRNSLQEEDIGVVEAVVNAL